MVCKWLASGLQVVHKPFASGLLASKPIQTLSKLDCLQAIKYEWFKNALVNKHYLLKALQVLFLQLLSIKGLASSLVNNQLLSMALQVP